MQLSALKIGLNNCIFIVLIGYEYGMGSAIVG
jgi:hypothetical protein